MKIMTEENECLKELFYQGLQSWKQEKPKEYNRLIGSLLYYGSVVGKYNLLEGRDGTLWTAVLRPQIEYLAEKYGKKPEDIIKRLFESKDHESFMLKLQVYR